MPVNRSTIKEQVQHMNCPHVWGAHLEIKAAATLFQLPISFSTWSEQSSSLTWSVHYPIPPNNTTFPLIVDEDLIQKKDISHIEMYHHRSHYEAIVSMESNQVCERPPQPTGKDDPKRLIAK